MKRTLSIALMSIATLVMIVLAIAPHHHHGDAICMVLDECLQDECASSKHNNHCEMPADETHNLCVVTEDILAPDLAKGLNGKLSGENSGSPHTYSLLCLIAGCLIYNHWIDSTPDYEHRDPITFYTSAAANRYHGLRAPPLS